MDIKVWDYNTENCSEMVKVYINKYNFALHDSTRIKKFICIRIAFLYSDNRDRLKKCNYEYYFLYFCVY